jgi:urease accessory protein
MSGCLKALFSRDPSRVDAILINSAGGLTSGDTLSVRCEVGAGASTAITTQAAERAYRAVDEPAQVTTQIRVAEQATMLWLPQELILFDGAALDRRLNVDLAESARLLLVEPVIFGRTRMGESLEDIFFHDRISIDRAGVPFYRDNTRTVGDAKKTLGRLAVADGAGAMASLVYVGDDAKGRYHQLWSSLPSTSGGSLLQDDLLVMRLLAKDGFELRKTLLPILDLLTDNTLPTSWRL